MKRWIEEGDDTYRAEGAVKKSVERYYKAKSSENRPQDRS